MLPEPVMDSEFPNQFRRSSYSKQIFFLFLSLAIGVVALAWMLSPRSFIPFFGSLLTRMQMPAIEAAGWINGPPPDQNALAGKVVVIEVWASWCGPCRKSMPALVNLHEAFANRAVVFVGLTEEGKEELAEVQKVIDSFGVTWSVGWGAVRTTRALEADAIPALYIFGANGRLAWSSADGGDIHSVLEREVQKVEAKSNDRPS